MATIAISGLPGSGSTTLARLLSIKLKCSYFSAGQLWKDVAQGSLENQSYFNLFKELTGRRNISLLKISSFSKGSAAVKLWKTDLGRNSAFHQAIEELQQELLDLGNIIIDGKLSIHMLKNPDLKVWLSGSLDARASRTSQRDNISYREARKLLKEREELHRNEWQKIYGFDYLIQQKEADLVIDSTEKTPEEIADLIVAKLNNKL